MTDFHPWAKKYTAEEAQRLIGAAPEHLRPEVAGLIAAVNTAHEQAKDYAETGRWFHVSRQKLAVGTVLSAGGGPASDPEFYAQGYGEDTGTMADMGGSRTEHLWLTTTRRDAKFWAKTLKAKFLYEVQPTDKPRPWNGTGTDGWVTTAAVVLFRTKL